MAYQKGKTEHSGSKKGKGSYYGVKSEAKKGSNKSRRKNKLNYGSIDILEETDLDMSQAKIRITGMIPYPLYKSLKEEAAKRQLDYIDLLSEVLEAYFEE